MLFRSSEPAPAAAPTPTVIRETTRTTQMRYTEQYYGGNGEEITYKEYLTGDDPFKAEFFEIPNEKKESEHVEAEAAEENVAAEETAAADEFVDDTADEFIDEAIDEFSAEDVDGIVDEEETEVEMVEETVDEAVEDALDGVAEETEEFVEDGLDWGVPAGLTQQETVVIDSYFDVPAEEVYDYADAYEEESAADAYDEAYDENPEEYAETFAEEAYDEDAYAETDGTEEYADEPVDETYAETDSEDGAYDEPVMKPRMNPDVALVSLSMLEENFEDGAQIDLAALKAKGLVLPTAKTLKIYNSGTVTKSFEIDAEQVTMEAIFAISHAGGHINFIKPKGGDNNVGFKGFQK